MRRFLALAFGSTGSAEPRFVLSLDDQLLLVWAVRFQFPPTRIDANGLSLRYERNWYSFKSSVVKLTIEVKVYNMKDC